MYETATAIGGFSFLRYLTVHTGNVYKKDLLKTHKENPHYTLVIT